MAVETNKQTRVHIAESDLPADHDTVRLGLEAELKEEKEIFSLFMEYSPIYVFFKDEKARPIQLSKNFEKMLGRPIQEVLGKNLDELFPSELARKMMADDLRVIREGKPIEVFEEFNGRVYESIKFPITRPGKSSLLAGFTLDITRRRQVENALQESQARLKESNQIMAGILGHTHMMAVYLDPHFNFIWVNRAYADTCHLDQSFFPGKNHFDLYPNEENQVIFQRVVDTGEPAFVAAKPFVFPNQPERGVTYWDWSLIPVENGAGKLAGLVFTLAEVTDRILMEQALKAANERLQAHVMEIESLQVQLQEQAIRDPLTGLFNRRYLQETLDREIARAGRGDRSIGLIIMDIDHFKKVNDAHGHRAGDKVLKALGELLQANIRTEDIPCRYGGEEFVIVLPGAGLEVAHERAELIRAKFEAMRVPYGNQELFATMSFGVAAFPIHGLNSDAVLIRADRALYRAKQSGRNRVVSYVDTARMPPP